MFGTHCQNMLAIITGSHQQTLFAICWLATWCVAFVADVSCVPALSLLTKSLCERLIDQVLGDSTANWFYNVDSWLSDGQGGLMCVVSAVDHGTHGL